MRRATSAERHTQPYSVERTFQAKPYKAIRRGIVAERRVGAEVATGRRIFGGPFFVRICAGVNTRSSPTREANDDERTDDGEARAEHVDRGWLLTLDECAHDLGKCTRA